MKGTVTLEELIRNAGVNPVTTRHPLPAPSQPAITASDEDHIQARNLLVEQRKNDPEYRDPSKQLKRIFRTSKTKEKLLSENWEFSQDELDRALTTAIGQTTTSPGLIQAFLNLGAKVNLVETTIDKKSHSKNANGHFNRRSTVLQRAATVRRADSVSILASAGADQTSLNEALKVALAANDHACILELLRHGADLNSVPNALANAIQSKDLNLILLLLRAPKAINADIVSSCLPAAVQLQSGQIISLLIGYGADPNFDGASALCLAISQHQYQLAVALVAGLIRLTPASLRAALESTTKLTTAQDLPQYLQLLFCCGLSPDSATLPGMLAKACKRNDTQLASLLLDYGVATTANDTHCLAGALEHGNWKLAENILARPVLATVASRGLTLIPADIPRPERLRIIQALVRYGASGPDLEHWLVKAVDEGDGSLMDLLLHSGATADSGSNGALQLAILRKDKQSLRALLKSRPPPQVLARAFPLLKRGYAPAERLEIVRLLLEHGAKGVEVDQALIDAIETSPTRDVPLIAELIRHGADVNYGKGKAIQIAVTQLNTDLLGLLLKARPLPSSPSLAIPHLIRTVNEDNQKLSKARRILQMLLANGVDDEFVLEAVRTALKLPSNIDLVEDMLKASPRLVAPAVEVASHLKDVNTRRFTLSRILSFDVPQNAKNAALTAELKSPTLLDDQATLELLLAHGASFESAHDETLSLAVATGSTKIFNLVLGGRKPSQSATTKAFRTLFKEPSRDTQSRLQLATMLLKMGVEQPAIDAALRTVLDDTGQDQEVEDMVNLLLSYKANVNVADGTCFVFAARRISFNVFKSLLEHNPDFTTILPTLITAKLDEEVLIKSLKLCFDTGLTAADLEPAKYGQFRMPSLVLAMREYPRGDALIRFLLEHGCNPDAMVTAILDSTVGPEVVTALLWALGQPQKAISSSVLKALLDGKSSPTRSAPLSELSPIALAAREGRQDVIPLLIDRGADASIRDKGNRSALFYACSTATTSTDSVRALAPHVLKDDGSLHEAARCLFVEITKVLLEHGHSPNFPSRLHGGRNALGELCLNTEIANGIQRTKARQLIRLLLSHGANPNFKARNERSTVLLALDNAHNPLEITEALLETEVWETLNDEKHMYRDASGLCYSSISYVELIPSPSRSQVRGDLISLLRDKGCEPKFYSQNLDQPQPKSAIGMPANIAKLANRQKEHLLSLRLAKEASDHARAIEEENHRAELRRQKERQDADLAAAAAAQAHWQSLEQAKHDFEVQRLQSTERVKRAERATWHSQQMEQEREGAAQRGQIEEQKINAGLVAERKMVALHKGEIEHRAGVERRALKEKEELFQRNVERQKALTERLDKSAELHAKLRQERPALEAAKWGSVD